MKKTGMNRAAGSSRGGKRKCSAVPRGSTPLSLTNCIHCGKECGKDEGVVCGPCYSKYTPGMLADLDQ